MKRSLFAGAAVLFALLFCARPSQAVTYSRAYPNPNGPWFEEVSLTIQDPPNGSRWAFGLFTNCQVPFLSSNYWYGSVLQSGYSPDTYSGGCQLENISPTNQVTIVGNGYFSAWTPTASSPSMQQYAPTVGWNSNGYSTGPGTPGYITTAPGWQDASASMWIDDNNRTYAGLNASLDNAFNCCQNGSGCP